MNAREFLDLQDAYQGVYQELDEVRGGGRIDPVSDMPGIGERGARSPRDAGLLLSPLERARARAKATPRTTTKIISYIASCRQGISIIKGRVYACSKRPQF